jgi:hypothetical protein
MNCLKIRNRLLADPTPAQPSVEVLRHLGRCAACRSLQRRLVEVEKQLPMLPVPPAPGRAAFLRRIRQGEGVLAPAVSTSDLWLNPRPRDKERGLRKVALAFALAAGLLILALGWWTLPHTPSGLSSKNPIDPYKQRQNKRDQLLAAADTPGERVKVLDDLAQGLHQEVQQLVRRSDDEQLRIVARFYREVVCDNLLENARQLPEAEKAKVLASVEAHLLEVESEVSKWLAARVPDAADPLRDIASASRESHNKLREIRGV